MAKTPYLLAALLLGSSPALADEIDAEKAGEVKAEIEQRQDAVRKQYEDHPLSPEERKELRQKLKEAADEVYEKNGTTDKEFTRATTHLGREGAKQMDESRKAAKEKAKAKAEAKPAAAEPKKGTVETTESGIVVEKGTDAANDPAGQDGVPVVTGEGGGADGQGDAPAPRSRHKKH